MTDQFKLPPIIQTPQIARTISDAVLWIDRFHKSVVNRDIAIVDRLENLIITYPIASLPTPDGTKRLFYATDTGDLYIDVFDTVSGTASWTIIASNKDATTERGIAVTNASGVATITFLETYPIADGFPSISKSTIAPAPIVLPAYMTDWIDNLTNDGTNYTGITVIACDNAGAAITGARVFYSIRKA